MHHQVFFNCQRICHIYPELEILATFDPHLYIGLCWKMTSELNKYVPPSILVTTHWWSVWNDWYYEVMEQRLRLDPVHIRVFTDRGFDHREPLDLSNSVRPLLFCIGKYGTSTVSIEKRQSRKKRPAVPKPSISTVERINWNSLWPHLARGARPRQQQQQQQQRLNLLAAAVLSHSWPSSDSQLTDVRSN